MNTNFTKAGSSCNVFFRLYISQCSSFCLIGNSTDKNALLQIGCKNHCAPPNISELFTRSEQVHSFFIVGAKNGMASPLNFISYIKHLLNAS